MINYSSNFTTNGVYLDEDGNRYRMYNLICSGEAQEDVVERLNKLRGVIVEEPQMFFDGSVGIDYCKRVR